MQFGFVFLSYYLFFFSMIKYYPIAYKNSLLEYNANLLYSMTWIIWCFTHNYIYIYFFILNSSSFHFIFYFSPEKCDISLHTYIKFIYSLLQF